MCIFLCLPIKTLQTRWHLALIPSRINGKEPGSTTLAQAIVPFLGFLRLGLHGEFPRFCSGVVDALFRGRPLSEETLRRLDNGG